MTMFCRGVYKKCNGACNPDEKYRKILPLKIFNFFRLRKKYFIFYKSQKNTKWLKFFFNHQKKSMFNKSRKNGKLCIFFNGSDNVGKKRGERKGG